MPRRTPRRACANIPRFIREAYEEAQRELGKDLNGFCLEASWLMVEWLNAHGYGPAVAIRYELPDGDGHWTLQVDDVEYDPTIAFWKASEEYRPKDALRNCIYVVHGTSPHNDWDVTETTLDRGVAAQCRSIVTGLDRWAAMGDAERRGRRRAKQERRRR